jgi:hypothetical protein
MKSLFTRTKIKICFRKTTLHEHQVALLLMILLEMFSIGQYFFLPNIERINFGDTTLKSSTDICWIWTRATCTHQSKIRFYIIDLLNCTWLSLPRPIMKVLVEINYCLENWYPYEHEGPCTLRLLNWLDLRQTSLEDNIVDFH